MAFHAGSRVDPTVDFMLIEIISPVRQKAFRIIFVLIARLQLVLVRMAVGAERFFVANFAGPALLFCVEAMSCRPVAGVVHCRPPVRVAIAADRETGYFNRMRGNDTGRVRTGVQADE